MTSVPRPFNCATDPIVPGVCLLEASAGTGKTYALARIFLRLVAEHGVEIGKILVVTFTSAATEELRGRIRELLVHALADLQSCGTEISDETIKELGKSEEMREQSIRRIQLALVCFDEAVIDTIHGFCNRVLTENSLETSALFEAELDQSADDLVVEAIQEYWRCQLADVHPVVAAASSLSKMGPDEMVKFYKSLPATQQYQFGFDRGGDLSSVRADLVRSYEDLSQAWVNHRSEYLQFVEQCVTKSMRAYKQLSYHAEIFDYMFGQGAVSPDGLKTLDDVKSSKLKVRKEFENDSKPSFAIQAENFCGLLQRFGLFLRLECSSFLHKRIESWKEARGLLSFDDLLKLTADAVSNPITAGESIRQSLRQAFDAALIDEFQDTDPVQFQIFRELFADTQKHWLYLIGDPKQSIYRFRGADLEAYFSFASNTGAKVYSLDTNYRTTSPLVTGINHFLSASKTSPFQHPQLSFHEVSPNLGGSADENKTFFMQGKQSPPLVLREISQVGDRRVNKAVAQEAIRTDMANEIFHLLEHGQVGEKKVGTGDIAILVRSNAEAREVWEYFRSRGLPVVVFTDLSLFETDEARELLWVLQGMANSRNDRSIKRALASGLLGMTTSDFQQWMDQPREWDQWVGRFRDLSTIWREEGIYMALRRLFRETGAIERNLGRPDGERRVTNFLHLAEVLHHTTTENPMSPSSLLVWLQSKMDQSDRSQEEYQLRLESESESIRILTVHKSKGLEYPITFIPFLGFSNDRKKGSFRYHSDTGELMVDLWELAQEENKERGRTEERREDARVLYVALTRASSCCYLYHPQAPPSDESSNAQGYLFEGIRNSVESLSVSQWVEQNGYGREITHSFLSLPVKEKGKSPAQSLSNTSQPKAFSAAEFPSDRALVSDMGVQSFSSLTRQIDFNGADLDGGTQLGGGVSDEVSLSPDPIFDFPAGAHAGNFMHDVFEHLQFDDSTTWAGLIERKLKHHQFDSAKWQNPIHKMIEQVMQLELAPGLRLGLLTRADRMEEMEFLFPASSFSLASLVSALPVDSMLSQYLLGVAESDWDSAEMKGFLTGKIDLIFRWNSKYYLLDWKSNRLNGRGDGFVSPAIHKEMLDHHYVLQYHLYVLALHLHLRARLPGYSYENDFGGVYYLFTRGICSSSQNGVFHDHPSYRVIDALEQFFIS
jgi:exodeoxyribonuclease V beta subunit